MIGSFWNLCRACPSMPVDKQLHSEYRSTYRWHEFTGNSRPEVVRRAPVPNQFGATNEPPLPRRKKCPELAYKSHEFIIGSEQTSDSRNNVIATRARSEERGTPSRRSKSEGPPAVASGRAFTSEINGTGVGESTVQPGESSGLLKQTISKLSTEYRIQFVWPNVRKTVKERPKNPVELPKKSQSMGAIKSSQTNAMPTVHKKRTANQKEATLQELEPLVTDNEERKPVEKQVTIVGKKTIRPFSQTFDQDRNSHFITRKENFGFEQKIENNAVDGIDMKYAMMNGNAPPQPNIDEWYKEVVELRKKAGEYKCRGWGVEIDPKLYKKQKELWDQVSKRSSLSALSLASSVHRPITKEEKEQENNKKFIPLKSTNKPKVPAQPLIDNRDESSLPARYSSIRHHLERTTGPDVEEGALLPSPTREKLMPAIPKSRESESQRGSPKKSAASRHGSPQKGSPQKGSPKKTLKSRSQSVGPGVIENESPKRQIRSSSTAPSGPKTTGKKTPVSTPTSAPATERKPRPSTLSTSTPSRRISSTLPPSGRAHSVPGNHQFQIPFTDTNKSPHRTVRRKEPCSKASKQLKPKSTTITLNAENSSSSAANATQSKDGSTHGADKPDTIENLIPKAPQDKGSIHLKLAENDGEIVGEKDTGISVSSCSPQPVPEVSDEPIVKSPPEPTRVKSPEQIIMRSPDPVNWTVPLDTGKTFTVTQNVKEGENYSRPQSEIKASTPVEKPPPAPQSAPPELTEQAKMDAWKGCDFNDPKSSSSPIDGGPKTNFSTDSSAISNLRYDKPVPGSTLRCLDDPTFDTEAPSSTPRNTATDVLEKARDRFDRFWGGSKEDNV